MRTSNKPQEWAFQYLCEYILKANSGNLDEVQAELGQALLPAFPAIGLYYPNPEKPGSYRWTGFDDNRRRLEADDVKYVDSQAESPSAAIESDSSREMESNATPAVDAVTAYEGLVRNPATPYEDRVTALQQWIIVDNDAAAQFVAEELQRGDLTAGWRNMLIYAAEDVRFPNEGDQRRVCRRLRELALELRNDTTAGIEQVVWSALRRFASLVPEDEAGSLIEFLNHRSVVDTRLAGLQSILCVFEITPPRDPTSLGGLADRVYGLAIKLIDPDVMTPGETSAIAEQAVHALAALGDSRVRDCLERLRRLGWDWLTHQVREDLCQLQEGWKVRDPTNRDHSAFVRIDSILKNWD